MKITFIIQNPWLNIWSLNHTGESAPVPTRTVQIELTPEQEKELELKPCGNDWDHQRKDYIERHEEILKCFVETEEPKP